MTSLTLALLLFTIIKPGYLLKPVTNQDCDQTKKACLFLPKGSCTGSSDHGCQLGFTWKIAAGGKALEFELFRTLNGFDASQAQYVAVGFNKESAGMYPAAVSVCQVEPTGKGNVWLNHNVADGPTSRRVSNQPLNSQVLNYTEGGFLDGSVICRFSQLIDPTSLNTGKYTVYNLNQSFYLIFGYNSVNGIGFSDNIGVHANKFSMGNMINPTNLSVPTPASSIMKPTLIKIHGVLMIFGWFVCISTAIMTALYAKKLWPDKKLFGGAAWFQLHRGLNLLGLLSIGLSLVIIFGGVGWEWKGPTAQTTISKFNDIHKHVIMGITCLIIAFIQPFGALLRPHPGTKYRILFNVGHGFMGLTALALSIATVFYASKPMMNTGLQDSTGKAFITVFAAATGFFMIIMAVITYYAENKKCPPWQVSAQYSTSQQNGVDINAKSMEEVKEKPQIGLLRTGLLGAFTIIAAVVWIVEMIMIVKHDVAAGS